MKNTVKKAIALSAGLAGAAVMVSCEGDDVTVREVTTSVDTTGLEAALANDGGNLPVAAPSAALFSISTLNMVVDSASGAFVAGSEYDFEFDSISFGSVRGADIQGFAPRNVNGELLTVSNWTSSGTTLSMSLASAPISFDDLELTFTSSLQNTLLGTWTADGGSTATFSSDTIVVNNSDNDNLVAVTQATGDPAEAPSTIVGYRPDASLQPEFRAGDSTDGRQLSDGVEAVLYKAPDAGVPADFQGKSVVFFRLTPDPAEDPIVVALADLDAILNGLTEANTLVNGEAATADWQLVALTETENLRISGAFSMDIEAFNGQTNTEASQSPAPVAGR